jgi:HK97 family phage major capsid protein
MEQFNAELSEMNLEQVKQRKAELEKEIRDAKDKKSLSGMEEKVRLVNERIAELEDLEKRKADVAALQNGTAEGAKVVETRKEEEKMNEKEIRNSEKYINAYAQYVKTGDDAECRALLSTNAEDGTVAVPDMVVSAIQTAWDNEPILARVKKTYLKGNVKIGFEISADGAVEHTEGAAAVTEEELVLGIATLVPVSIKKWISVSDEALDLSGEAFLQYIYAELGYQIAKKLADEIVADITATTASGSATVPAQAVITAAPGLATIASAVANLSDEAVNPVVIMNKLTYADFKTVQAGANYGQDVFDGLTVLFNNSLPSYSAATAGSGIYAIVGDLGTGEMVNFPNGNDITFKFDDKTLMAQDLVKVLGRLYAGHAVVAPKRFTLVKKPSQG